jgi:hypothetical protein
LVTPGPTSFTWAMHPKVLKWETRGFLPCKIQVIKWGFVLQTFGWCSIQHYTAVATASPQNLAGTFLLFSMHVADFDALLLHLAKVSMG